MNLGRKLFMVSVPSCFKRQSVWGKSLENIRLTDLEYNKLASRSDQITKLVPRSLSKLTVLPSFHPSFTPFPLMYMNMGLIYFLIKEMCKIPMLLCTKITAEKKITAVVKITIIITHWKKFTEVWSVWNRAYVKIRAICKGRY